MFQKTTEEQVQDALQKAQEIEQLVNSPGWKHLMSLIDHLVTKETAALATGELDDKYLKKIGFVQSVVYFQALPTILKDKKMRDYILTQGRVAGFRWLQKAPQLFFDGRQAFGS